MYVIRQRRIEIIGNANLSLHGAWLAHGLPEIKVAITMLPSRFEILSVATAHSGAPAEKMGFVMEPEALRMRLSLRSDEVN